MQPERRICLHEDSASTWRLDSKMTAMMKLFKKLNQKRLYNKRKKS